MNTKELLDRVGGRKIESMEISENDSNEPVHVVLHFDTGEKLEFSCTSYNYGPQHLVLDFN